MNTRGKAPVRAYVSVGVHVGVPIALRLEPDDTVGAEIDFGLEAELVMDFADVESLERLRDVAAEGARLLRQRAGQQLLPAARVAAEQPGGLVGAGVDR